MSILQFFKKSKPQGEISLDQKLSDFLSKSLLKEYAPRKTRKAAVCQESIKRVIDFGTETFDSSKPCVMIWKSQKFDTYRFKKTVFTISGKECGNVTGTDLLSEDLGICTHLLPMALCFGCRPEIEKIAETDFSEKIDAFLATGLDCDSPVRIVECFTQELNIPAQCNLVLEGYIKKNDSTRTFHTTCITKRLS